MLQQRIAFSLLGLSITLGCGGLFVDQAGVAAWSVALLDVEPVDVLPMYLDEGAALGLVNPVCGGCLAGIGSMSPDLRGPIGAYALTEASCVCPATCASRALTAVVDGEPDQRMAGVGTLCDAEGPDPIFSESLLPLRLESRPVDYALVRTFAESMDVEALRERLAIGLALAGAPVQEPTEELTVDGADATVFTDAVEALAGCGEDVAHRLVVAPDGHVAAVSSGGGCIPDPLAALVFPESDAWHVVDVAWAVSAMVPDDGDDDDDDDHDDDDDDDDDDAPDPEEDTPEATEPEPGEPEPAKPGGSAPQVRHSKPAVTGGLDQAVVQKILRRHQNQIQYCYHREAVPNPSLAGSFTATISVSPNGSVSDVTLNGSVDRSVDACVKGRLMRASFPSPSGGGKASVTVEYTFSAG